MPTFSKVFYCNFLLVFFGIAETLFRRYFSEKWYFW